MILISILLFIGAPPTDDAQAKGIAGEALVNYYAKSMLDEEHYHLIENITLPTRNGTTQIDHIIVSIYGVFVVETKNLTGWIFGDPKKYVWTQIIYGYSKNKFQNPLYQNYKHVRVLQSALTLSSRKIHSVIVFVGDSEFQTAMPENVTYDTEYIDFIKSKKEPVLTTSQVTKIIDTIETLRLPPSSDTDLEHARNIENMRAKKGYMRATKANSSTPSCPRCGSFMVLRKAKRGDHKGREFWGCQRFPRCRGIMNVTQPRARVIS